MFVPVEEHIDFNTSALDLLKKTVPPIDAESRHPLFRKYGYMTCGICDVWRWRRNVDTATESELWQMIALAQTDTANYYRYLYQKVEHERFKKQCIGWASKNPEFNKTLAVIAEEEQKLGYRP